MSTELFDNAKEHFHLKNPFVVYRKPAETQLRLLVQYGSALHKVENFMEKGFVMAPFDNETLPILLTPDLQAIEEYKPSPLGNKRVQFELPVESGDKARHKNLVSNALKEINTGKLQKVVVSRKIELEYDLFPLEAFQKLLNNHPSAFCYLWFHPLVGLWLGATPELLLLSENNFLTTYALAGTKALIAGKEPQWSFKEFEEQGLVTDYILDQFSLLELHSEASVATSVKAGKLWHLKSKITARRAGADLKSIISKLHPTPAVCGIPKIAAFQFILNSEGYQRKFYTGFLGELNFCANAECELYVNLRCMEWQNKRAMVYIGGGITGRSNPEAEWQETVQKSYTVIDALFNSQK
ncbi:MAG: chorismate-binding protein [Flavobacteriaceae bacterium]